MEIYPFEVVLCLSPEGVGVCIFGPEATPDEISDWIGDRNVGRDRFRTFEAAVAFVHSLHRDPELCGCGGRVVPIRQE